MHELSMLIQATIDGMGARITELLASSQSAGEQGNVDAAQAAAAQADIVKVRCNPCYDQCMLARSAWQACSVCIGLYVWTE